MIRCEPQRTTAKCKQYLSQCAWLPGHGCRDKAFQDAVEPGDVCKFYRSILTCNDSSYGCVWQKGKRCVPKQSIPVNDHKTHDCAWKTKKNCLQHDDCFWTPSSKSMQQKGLCQKTQAAYGSQHLETLRKKCLHMHDPVSFDSFDDQDIAYIRNVVPIGKAVDANGRRHCFHFDSVYQHIIRKLTSNTPPLHPITNEPLSQTDLQHIYKLKSAYVKTIRGCIIDIVVDTVQVPIIFVESIQRYFSEDFQKISVVTINVANGVGTVETLGHFPLSVSSTFINMIRSKVSDMLIRQEYKKLKRFFTIFKHVSSGYVAHWYLGYTFDPQTSNIELILDNAKVKTYTDLVSTFA